MSVTDISEARWDRADKPKDTKPLDAVRACLREVAEDEAVHIIVAVAKLDTDGAALTKFYQAGRYNAHGQIGLLGLVEREILSTGLGD